MCPDDDIGSICSEAGLIKFFKKGAKYHSLIYVCVCTRACMPAYGLFVCPCFVSAFLSMRGQQLVKCYQVDEKLQQIPFIISWKRKLTK